ncbi:ABC transporter ATP-binding protein [Catellatospora sp. KI3]|uniref:ABC transporter ATP-binding protein n=1 Tax=Catellatospora sp. KI3 TaxID=3041620 RepID=UPI00248317CB|nr:ABC transporter ATP-binding protein [Catellatospora sp. KI3]MDI1460951.1 ABC transporter ATP-binding protein [Catellatospora sp. KI3]
MWDTLRRALRLSPELGRGLAVTLLLAVGMTAGRAAVPVAVQRAVDDGLRGPGGPDFGVVALIGAAALAVLAGSMWCGYAMMLRLFEVSESALAAVRVKVFRHVHDLPVLRIGAQQRGALVARATSDVDQVTSFLQWNGVVLFTCAGQTLVTGAVMCYYSWPLALVVLAVFAPVAWVVRACMRSLAEAYGAVRQRSAEMLAVVSESVAGAEVIRSYDASARTVARLDEAVDAHRLASQRASRLTVTAYSVGELATGVALAATAALGVVLGVAGRMTVGEIAAFLFLVAQFALPAQVAGEMLNGLQSAVAGWRRVLDILDEEPDTAEHPEAVDLPPGPVPVRLRGVSYAYPDTAEPVLREVDLDIAAGTRVAVVGRTGAGKTTLVKLVTRLVAPAAGQVLLAGVPVDRIRLRCLRERVVLVPQEGFLFHGSLADNVRFGRALGDGDVRGVLADLGLLDWAAGLPDGLDTVVGERGEGLSVGERQLVAVARAHAADADLLILDEATSAVDPATEVRLRTAMDRVSRGRTTITIAHRLATARGADEVVVVDDGRVVQRGHHDALVARADSPYAKLHAAWLVGEQALA